MRTLILWLAALALGAPAVAAPSDVDLPQPGLAAPVSYAFGPGDVIEVTVSSHSGYDRTLTIQPDGRIQFPLAGEIVAAGLTPTQLAARIQEGLNAELVDPRVTVSLKEPRRDARRVSVLGAVKSPGVFDLKEKSTLTELLAAAGGPLPQADLSRITVTHADRSRVDTVDLSRTAQSGRADGDVALEVGDLIIVPAGVLPTVHVMGEVARPGSFEMQGKSCLLDALTQVGGPTPRADLAHVRLTRGGQSQVLDLKGLALGDPKANPATNLLLQPGDTIVVPENGNQVYVLGDVVKPDAYLLREGEHLFDVLTRAGGPGSQADTHKAVLMRRDENGQPVAQRLDLARMLQKGDMRQNMALQPGDVILIPSTGSHAGPLSSLTHNLLPFATLVRLFAGW